MKKSVSNTAADPLIDYSLLKVDDQTFKLCFSFNALALAEAVAGVNLLRGLKNYNDLSALELRGLLYAALTTAHPDMTIEQTSHLIRIDTIGEITLALGKAYTQSLPESKRNVEPEPETLTQTA